MPPLRVISAPAEQGKTNSALTPQIWITGIGLSAAAAASLWLFRKRTGWAVVYLIAALAFTGGGFALTANQTPGIATDAASSQSPIEQGEALFLAKGCITCHEHTQVTAKYDVFSGISGPAGSAPDLSHYTASPAFLRLWLADPREVKPATTMPDLELSTEEIESLIAFLVEDPASSFPNNLSEELQKNCPVTQPPDPPFQPQPAYLPIKGHFWYGTNNLWTSLYEDGVWWALPYDKESGGHYVQKIFWWNEDYDWQTEPLPAFSLTARRLDGPATTFESSEATNAYTPEFGSAILTGIEIPTLGCWEVTGSYKGHELSFVVWVAP